MSSFITCGVLVIEQRIEVVTKLFGEHLDGVGCAGGLNPLVIEIDPLIGGGIGTGCSRHGGLWQQLNRWDVAAVTAGEPLRDSDQLVRWWIGIKFQSVDGRINQSAILCPELKAWLPLLLQ